MKKLCDPKETILALLYKKPLPIEKISEELYTSRNTRANRYVHELENNGLITIKSIDKKDYKKRICQPTSKALFNSIVNQLEYISKKYDNSNFQLNEKEKTCLKKFLESPWFLQFASGIMNSIDLKEVEHPFLHIKLILSYHCMYLFAGEKYYSAKFGWELPNQKVIDALASKDKTLLAVMELSLPLLEKLGNLSDLSTLQFKYYDSFVKIVEDANREVIKNLKETIKELKEKKMNTNGNGHGLE